MRYERCEAVQFLNHGFQVLQCYVYVRIRRQPWWILLGPRGIHEKSQAEHAYEQSKRACKLGRTVFDAMDTQQTLDSVEDRSICASHNDTLHRT